MPLSIHPERHDSVIFNFPIPLGTHVTQCFPLLLLLLALVITGALPLGVLVALPLKVSEYLGVIVNVVVGTARVGMLLGVS
jgi:hypothetical protein